MPVFCCFQCCGSVCVDFWFDVLFEFWDTDEEGTR